MKELIPGQSYICSCGKVYEKKNNVIVALPTELGELAKEEAEYHDHLEDDANNVHQLNAWRNVYYHTRLHSAIKELRPGSLILEIGAGSGHDAQHFLPDYKMVLSDISSKTLERLSTKLHSTNATYVAADGMHLPFADNTFDSLYMVAVWHHFSDYGEALKEFARVLKSGGKLCIWVEPNKTYFLPLKIIRPIMSRLTHTDEHNVSHADAEMTGFSYRKINYVLHEGKWEKVSVRPMWLFAGWIQYILEFTFRAFKLKKRIVLPLWLEKGIVAVDEMLFKIPGFKHLGWHWTIGANKIQKSNLKTQNENSNI